MKFFLEKFRVDSEHYKLVLPDCAGWNCVYYTGVFPVPRSFKLHFTVTVASVDL